MPIDVSIKNVSDELVERLRRRGERSHRSLQEEIRSILTEELGRSPSRISVQEARRLVAKLGPQCPGESAAMVRGDRESR
jgi:antitoxin FitA